MAETLLSIGVQKLWDLLVRESDQFKGVNKQFDELKSDIDLLRSFLKDADDNKHASELVKICVKEINEIVFDAEDIIETFLLKKELSKTSGIKKHMKRVSWFMVDRRELASEMRGLSKRISKLIKKMMDVGVQQITVHGGKYSYPLQETQKEMQKMYPINNDSDLVGLEDNVKTLVSYLVKEDSSHVISITGMGGIGKTTLARQVFNHEMVKSHFDEVAWVCISQQFETKYVWQTILKNLSLKYENKVSSMTEDEVREELFHLLESRKPLIVLDDMWKEEDWDRLKPAFPPRKGWKMLLTSRNERVGLHVDPKCVNFKPECLSIEESWTLFQMIAFPRKDTAEYKVDVKIEELGKKMIKYCGGLPLAVKVLGGLLARKYSLSEWEKVGENIGSHIIGGTSYDDRNISSIYQILYLSFEELPTYLKHCFLYLAHFPEDYLVDVSKLSYYLEADGIQRPEYYHGLTVSEVANGYIEELVKRNMVISRRDKLTSKFESFHLHDMMREVCLRKAEEENFVHVVDSTNSKSPCKSRRIAVHGVDDIYQEGLMKNPKLRSLLFIQGSSPMLPSTLLFTRLQLLRELDLSYFKFEGGKLHTSIGKLIHLRYLSLFRAEVTRLPSSMRNLKLLLYLNLCVDSKSPLRMSNNIFKEMRELAYLSLPQRNVHSKVKMRLGNLVNLETLINFSTSNSSVRDLHHMTRLKRLLVLFNGGCTMETLSLSLSELRHLENLSVYDHKLDTEEGFVLDCVHLKQLELSIYMPRLPEEQRFPSHLTTITLEGCRLEKDPMLILENLLQLKKVCLWENSFCGRRMVSSRGGFPQLHKLELKGLFELEKWIVEEGSMPLLHSLYIGNCQKLGELPDGLRFIVSLKKLEFYEAPVEIKKKLSGGEDFYKVQHIPVVRFGDEDYDKFFKNRLVSEKALDTEIVGKDNGRSKSDSGKGAGEQLYGEISIVEASDRETNSLSSIPGKSDSQTSGVEAAEVLSEAHGIDPTENPVKAVTASPKSASDRKRLSLLSIPGNSDSQTSGVEAAEAHGIDPTENLVKSVTTNLKSPSGMTGAEECILVFSCNGNRDVDKTSFIQSISKELHKREVTPLMYNLLGKENLEKEILKRSRVGIMILSEGYASTQYLDHLIKIMEYKKAANLEIIPIYFKATVSDICGLEGGFEPMYLQYMVSTQPDRVQKWKETMAEIVSVDGHEWTKENQILLTEEVVRNACLRLCLKNSKNVVSILAFLHHSKPSEAEIVGLWGMAGIGKTSIAREIFGVLSPQYDICYFLQDFYLMCQEKGLRQMRDDFLSKVFREDNLSISACDIRPSFMKDLFQNKTILIVLDDVVDARDVEAVVGGFGWFSHGHRIILTSRQKQVLVQCKVKEPIEIQKLCETESFRLCKQYLDEESVVISELISYSSGIPLALEVLGSSVSKQDINNKKEQLQRLRKNPPTQIQEAFHKSFDRLDKDAKNIFLDIACFFAEENKEYVVELLDACGFLTYMGICDLTDESLISLLDNNRIEIPIPFQDIGRFIVREEADDPCERSRLWDSSDIADVLTNNSGTEAIEAIFLNTSDKACELKNPNVFDKMHNLRLLKFYCSTSENECKLSLPQGLDTLPDELRLLHWEHYPLKHLPQNFWPENLVELNMPFSKMEKLWEGKKNLKTLKKIKLSHSICLTDIQVLSEAMNLELIDLEGCASLVDISTSIPPCGKLVSLNMKDCSHLRSLPAMVDLISLKVLNLSGCEELKEIQDIAPNLTELYLAETAITELPLSIKNLTKLVILDLENCRRLQKLPSEVRNSRSIVDLKLSGCTRLAKLKALDCGTSKY